ncbi:tetratricopeptide repeat protein [Paenibacillus sp. MER TA 81-3]|uniref:tetratricopeptide repeat protein n=1 Tax=Paenibacillus sp. MER TA 81-3 TaxID=2939573 RepID=UPI00203F82AF|nr:tetratricopeptide repeat protein [Paenibacillus sp. MER TA 81-3]MCM3342727.1 tetratricopeptide repeat protein [Paenibacillus sp. MER TA 81-3]
MRIVEIKVKHLVLGLGLACVLTLMMYFIAPALFYQAGKYNTIIRWFPTSAVMADVLYESTDGVFVRDNQMIYVGEKGTFMTGPAELPEPMSEEEAVRRLEWLLHHFPTYKYVNAAKGRLAYLYMNQNRWDEAEQIFQELSKNEKYINSRNASEIKFLATRHERPYELPKLSGTVLVEEKPLPGAYVSLVPTEASSYYMPPPDHYPTVMTDENGRFRFYGIEAGAYTLTLGTVFRNIKGHTLSSAGVDEIELSSDKSTQTVDVRFRKNIRYEPVSQPVYDAEDVVALRWSSDPEAAYYKVELTEVVKQAEGKWEMKGTHLFEEKHVKPEAEYTVDELRHYPLVGGATYLTLDNHYYIDNGYVLGIAYPGSQWKWTVKGYDHNDNAISSSNDYMQFTGELPLLTTSPAGFTEADRLALDGKYSEAIAMYEREGSEDAIRKIARIYFSGLEWEQDGDYAKALTYLERIQHPTTGDLKLMEACYDQTKNAAKKQAVQKRLKQLAQNA